MTKRGIVSVQIILSYAQELGWETDSLLQDSEIDVATLSDVDGQIEGWQELKVLENLLRLQGDPFKLGVELGLRYQLTSYGIVGYALLASSTLRKAAEVGFRYLSLTYAFSHIQLHEAEGLAQLNFSCDIAGELGDLVLIRDIWAVSVIQKELFAGLNIPIELHLICSRPLQLSDSLLQTWCEQMGGKILFDQPHNAYVGLAPFLDAPLMKANAITAQICEQQCSQLLQQKQRLQGTAYKVRECLLHHGLDQSMDEVCRHLARSSRTLHRQLKEEGTSWREVRDDVRMGLAEELLIQPLQLDEIAERLGFSDGANFSHSFKRCKGVTPSAYRQRLLMQHDV